MPRGVRTIKSEENMNENGRNAPQNEGVLDENESKSTKSPKSVFVDNSFTPESVLVLDSRGTTLLFEQGEKFLLLGEDTIRAMSAANKQRYAVTKQFQDTLRQEEDEDFVKSFVVDREFVGSAGDKLDKLTLRDGIQQRWARPDRVNAYLEKGYKVLSKEDATSYLGAKGGHHEISKNGKTELVLMGIPKKLFDESQKKKIEKNKDLAMAWRQSGVEALSQNGGKGFVATDEDKNRSWNDLEN